MKRLIYTAFLFVLLGTLGQSVMAQKILTLEECRNQAIEFNQSLANADYMRKEAEANKKAARTAYLPSLQVTGSTTFMPDINLKGTDGMFLPTADSDEQARNGEFSGTSDVCMPGIPLDLEDLTYSSVQLGIEQPIYAGGKIRNSNIIADKVVDISNEAYKLKYSEVIEATDKAYWNLVSIREKIKVAERYVEMLTELEVQLNNYYDVGLVPKSEKLKVTVQKNEANLNLFRARNGNKIARMYLNRIIGMDLNSPIEVEGILNEQVRMPELENSMAKATENRAELKMLSYQVGISELQKKIVAADFKPQLGAAVNYSYLDVKDFQTTDGNFMVAAQLKIPIFHWGEGKHRKNAAQHGIKQAKIRYNDTQDLVKLEVQQAIIRFEEGYEAIQLAQKSKEEAEESLEETRASFELGLNNTTDLLNAQASWQQAQAGLIESLAQFEVLKTTYQKAIGELYLIEN